MKLVPAVNLVPHYMNDPGSLTKRLKARCDNFHIIEQEKGKLDPSTFFRQSILMNNQSSLILARSSLMSEDAVIVNKFCELGDKSLGEQLLFAEQNVKRSEYTFFHVSQLDCGMINLDRTEIVYARRSYFRWQSNQLSLLEIFLPDAHDVLEGACVE
ncbi:MULTISPECIES: chorismate lyase [unclassified Moritella]|uniref:chorismate--pyruvate lyase family protein n=1 Tax=unclassified Moritella TaxID=2637987 RepID=UPI001BAD0CEE|nr:MULTISPECIES: chorismate lyase [unclassified Moritella]QUM85815.1 chorismate lyase [Moritella sp. 28]QUM90040.1 chorismate lyase [Moritella sp. 36]